MSASAFVLGTLFSGSTLIGRGMTTRIKGAHYVGELNNLTQAPGLSHETTEPNCGPCSLLGEDCPHFTDKLRDHVTYDDIPGMHRRLAGSLKASLIIDGSKYVAWLRLAIAQGRAAPADRTPLNVIVTARNPIAYALSHRNRTGQPLWQGANIWRDTYVDALRTANTYGLPLLVMRYEDYMADTERSLERLSGFLHLPLNAAPDTTAIHDTGGNWSSFVPYLGKERVEQHIERSGGAVRAEAERFVRPARPYWNDEQPKEDTRWHRSLNADEANALLSTPGLTDVAGLLGYNIAEIVQTAVRPARARQDP
ncbi:sulfotransferase [Actinomadura soli]|uniref:Sulfotransferase n=1 Tax=Actinomadura soli TaxID=2508997 RepID=A0A5C4JEU0_9ACTN|nr:sulfotransferase [Actinomadura soli]TMR03668.1 sulfotransferase [Actinomadura soli]